MFNKNKNKDSLNLEFFLMLNKKKNKIINKQNKKIKKLELEKEFLKFKLNKKK